MPRFPYGADKRAAKKHIKVIKSWSSYSQKHFHQHILQKNLKSKTFL